jgi:hypothetical protein
MTVERSTCRRVKLTVVPVGTIMRERMGKQDCWVLPGHRGEVTPDLVSISDTSAVLNSFLSTFSESI